LRTIPEILDLTEISCLGSILPTARALSIIEPFLTSIVVMPLPFEALPERAKNKTAAIIARLRKIQNIFFNMIALSIKGYSIFGVVV
jgi:hypothetical protein